MRKFIIKNTLLTSIVIILLGLSYSNKVSASEYDGRAIDPSTALPSDRTAREAGIFSGDINGSDNNSGDMFIPPIMKAIGDDDEDDGFDSGGGEDCPTCYNDSSIGSGIFVLSSLLIAYGGVLFLRRRKTTATV